MKKAYQKLLESEQLHFDAAQNHAVDALAELASQLENCQSIQQKKLHFAGYFASKPKLLPKGLYFHGRVGRGKTMLMDLFYQHVNFDKKKRLHFHHFIENVHQQLATLVGKADPLAIIASSWAQEFNLLCFDEFFVNDIGDAMLLSGLFSALFEQGVTLVATSNCQPEQLYHNGLQRERFLPTIALLNQYCQIISIDGDIDHRLSDGQLVKHYANYFLLAQQGNEQLLNCYKKLTLNNDINTYQSTNSNSEMGAGLIRINHRDIAYLAKSKNIIYFDFFALCSGPRSQRDYIEIAKLFTTVIIRNVPQFSGRLIPAVFSGVEVSFQRRGVLMGELRQLDDEARRFIALVDEFYDQNIGLVMSAEVDIPELYQGKQLAFEFARCQSRLFEMQQTVVSNNN
jgi:cell division protein ZapE